MITVVLLEPEHPGNIGAIARAMQNFGVSSLFIVNPKCDHLSEEAKQRSVHATGILKKAKTGSLLELKKFDIIIGTTARLGTDYNIRRSPLLPSELARKLNTIDLKKRKVALVFGRESTGLSNNEIALCDFLVTIPTDKSYPSLNVSHAVAVILYELTKENIGTETIQPYPPITAREKEELFKIIDARLDETTFPTKEKRETQKKVLRHIIGKAMLTKREAFALFSFLKKVR
jgi:tRNA/rRNA methyltransferase